MKYSKVIEKKASPMPDVCTLDGEWEFCINEEELGSKQEWLLHSGTFSKSMIVPGAWDAQGFGEETRYFRSSHVGKAWYRKKIDIPKEWAGERIFLLFGGVYRYARVWINGSYLGEHKGYVSEFEFEITSYVSSDLIAIIAVEVDSRRRVDMDGLVGCRDFVDCVTDTENEISLEGIPGGGIHGHVKLEARPALWLEDVFVQTELSPSVCYISARLEGAIVAFKCLKIEVSDASGEVWAREVYNKSCLAEGDEIRISLPVLEARPWTPESPNLYLATLSLEESSGGIYTRKVRFGFRKIEIRGNRFFLNGNLVFLQGIGDDCIYLDTVCPPTDKEYYLKRLRVMKDYGFNHIRHHSHSLPAEYYDACDELGMLVGAELPLAYPKFAKVAEHNLAWCDLYRQEWRAMIKRLRNHPSVFHWAMGNELFDGFILSQELFETAKRLDPSRPVIDSDGLFGVPGTSLAGLNDPFVTDGYGSHSPYSNRSTLDFYSITFNVLTSPLENPEKYRNFDTPKLPILAHESGNFVTFPRLDQLDRWPYNLKPIWLEQTRKKLIEMGVEDEWPIWAKNSEQLYYQLHKADIEEIRKNENISGYHWWLFQDFHGKSNGLVDASFRPKSILPEQVRQFNNSVVVLQDGLKINYSGGDSVKLTFSISNYSGADLLDAKINFKICGDGEEIFYRSQSIGLVSQGLDHCGVEILFCLPCCSKPQKITVDTELHSHGKKYTNRWSSRLFPSAIAPPDLQRPIYVSNSLWASFAPYSVGGKRIFKLDLKKRISPGSLCISNSLTPKLKKALRQGSSVLLFNPADLQFLSHPIQFKSAWWYGGYCGIEDFDVGTVVYDHPVTCEMAPDGWCDISWQAMIQGGNGYLLDQFPTKPNSIIRNIEVFQMCRDKSCLFEWSFEKSKLIVSGLNLGVVPHSPILGPINQPEIRWLMIRLLEYAAERAE